MKRFSVVLVALAVTLASFSVFATGEMQCKGDCSGVIQQKKMSSTQENGGLYKFNENIKPFVPSDLTYANRAEQWSLICNEDGSAKNSPGGPVTGDCGDYVSHTTKTKWRLHKSTGHIDKIFLIDQKGRAHRHVEFAGGSDVYRVTYLSPKAEKTAENNGYVIDKRNNTMVAKGSSKDDTQVAQQPKTGEDVAKNEDCASKGSTLEKAKCIGEQSGAIGAVIKGLPKF